MPFMRSNRIFALVDCNNFFVSCERAFNPRLWEKPVLVLSNNDGCVISRSNEVKALGIRMGAPFYQVKDIVAAHGVAVFSPNFTLYGDLSHRVMRALATFTPEVEVYSIDEAFLDLTRFKNRDLTEYGREIRQTILKWTGIPVSVGIAETKTLAKVAAEIAKTSAKTGGVLDLTRSRYQALALARLPVGEVWGVGRRFSERLAGRGVKTALDLREASDVWLKRHFPSPLIQTVLELRGVCCLPLASLPAPKKSIACTRSFGQLVTDKRQLQEAVATYAARACEKLRGDHLVANAVEVFIRTSRFRDDLPQYANSATLPLPVPSDGTPEILRLALRTLDAIYAEGYQYHKAGVLLLGLCPAQGRQQGLFDPQDRARIARLMQALDQINLTHGAGTLRYGAEGVEKRWKMRQAHRSAQFTARWDELATVLI